MVQRGGGERREVFDMSLSAFPSPWKSIWFHPRQTIRILLDSPDSDRYAWKIAKGFGIVAAVFAGLEELGRTNSSPWIFLWVVLATYAYMLFSLWLTGQTGAAVGKWMDGCGSARDVRIAAAWSWAPALLIYPVQLAATGYVVAGGLGTEQLFETVPGMMFLSWTLLICFWSVGVGAATVSVAHRFGVVKGAVTSFVMSVPSWLLGMLIYLPSEFR